MNERIFRLLYLSVLSQSIIDNIEDGIGDFTKKHKQFAKNFLAETLKIIGQDLGNAEAAEQLFELSVWIKQMFHVMLDVAKIEEGKSNKSNFQKDFDLLLKKYNVEIKA